MMCPGFKASFCTFTFGVALALPVVSISFLGVVPSAASATTPVAASSTALAPVRPLQITPDPVTWIDTNLHWPISSRGYTDCQNAGIEYIKGGGVIGYECRKNDPWLNSYTLWVGILWNRPE